VLGALRDAGVNLIAFWGYPSAKGARLDFIPEDGEAFIAAAKKTKLRVRRSIAFYVHDDDRPGAVADILKKLADARISLGAMQAVCGGAGTYGGVISLSPAAARKAAGPMLAFSPVATDLPLPVVCCNCANLFLESQYGIDHAATKV
jgi:hypothetical protein